MKNNWILTFLSLSLICPLSLQGADAVILSQIGEEIVIEQNAVADTIRQFRTFEDILEAHQDNPDISTVGVESRYISGSGQFTATNIVLLPGKVQEVAQTIDGIIVVDLRMESHLFINDIPHTWKSYRNQINLGLGATAIEKDEMDRLNFLAEEGIASVFRRGKPPEDITITTASLERTVVEEMGLSYVRLPVLDYSHPADQEVDAFISIIMNNPNHWLHIHCHAGRGRTTTFLTLYDMYHNAKEVCFDEILFRQKAIGGSDFIKHETVPYSGEDAYKQDWVIKRLEFLKAFYRYCQEADLEQHSWSDWSRTYLLPEQSN